MTSIINMIQEIEKNEIEEDVVEKKDDYETKTSLDVKNSMLCADWIYKSESDSDYDFDSDSGYDYDNYNTFDGYVSNELLEENEFQVFEKTFKTSLGMIVVFTFLTVSVGYFLL